MKKRFEDSVYVALDFEDPEECVSFARNLGPRLRKVKIGSVPFARGGLALLEELHGHGYGLFLDLKYHDIPSVVFEAISAVGSKVPLELATVHASGGKQMISMACDAMSKVSYGNGKIVAVTVLTSLEDTDCETLGISGPSMEERVLRFGKMALDAGANGLVCSPLELGYLRKNLGPEPFLVVPGIRNQVGGDDQRRTMPPGKAFKMGASALVVGRPIRYASHPREAFESILHEVEENA